MREYEVCHYCFGQGCLENEGYTECPYCDGAGFEDVSIYNDEQDEYDFNDRGEGWWQ